MYQIERLVAGGGGGWQRGCAVLHTNPLRVYGVTRTFKVFLVDAVVVVDVFVVDAVNLMLLFQLAQSSIVALERKIEKVISDTLALLVLNGRYMTYMITLRQS